MQTYSNTVMGKNFMLMGSLFPLMATFHCHSHTAEIWLLYCYTLKLCLVNTAIFHLYFFSCPSLLMLILFLNITGYLTCVIHFHSFNYVPDSIHNLLVKGNCFTYCFLTKPTISNLLKWFLAMLPCSHHIANKRFGKDFEKTAMLYVCKVPYLYWIVKATEQ